MVSNRRSTTINSTSTMNETPEFMKACLFGARRSWRLSWCVTRAAKKANVQFEDILNRPKTPTENDMHLGEVTRWLALYFPLVFMAICEGRKDAEIMRIWASANRRNVHQTCRLLKPEELKEINKDRKRAWNTRFVNARDLSKRHDWNTVK